MNGLRRTFLALYSLLLIAAAAGIGVLAWNQDRKLDVNVSDLNLTGAILTATVNTGGTGYQVGDMVKVTGGGGSGATLRITAVSSGGAAAVSIINPGSGYRTTSGAATTAVSGAGAGSTVDINQLLPGSFVEVDGFVDTNGNFVANSVDVEDQEVVENHKIALLGYVTSVTRDSGGNLTQFNLYVREEEPDDEFDVNLDSVVVVKVSSPTVYQFSSRPTNSQRPRSLPIRTPLTSNCATTPP